jgi:hypothetical protein
LLGKPTSQEVGYGEDDSGHYEEVTLTYSGLQVFFVTGVVDRMVATDPKSCTANGICPGATMQQVRQRVLEHSEEFATSDLQSFVICPEDDFPSDYYLTIDYGAEGQVVNLELVLDRP